MVKKKYLLGIVLIISFLTNSLLAQQALTAVDQKAILAASESILKEVSDLRGLPAKNPVKSGFKSRKELEDVIIKDLNEEHSPEELKSQGRLLKKFGLIPKDYDLRQEMIKLLQEQIGGFYEPRTGEFYLVDWLELSEQKPVMAHELMHAVQDQNFNLKRFEKFPKDEGDQELAVQSLIEGEATIVMFNYMFKSQGLKMDITKVPISISTLMDLADDKMDDKRFPVLASTPKAIKETLEFPYFYGGSFIQQYVGKTSWEKVADLYSSELPESTEQIIHPEKAINREHPIKVKLPDQLTKLGTGWQKAQVNINGEFGYYLVFAQYLDKQRAREAAAGWGGDQMIFYEKDADHSLISQATVWDTEQDAIEFFQAYKERTLKRYPETKSLKEGKDEQIYDSNEGLVWLARRGTQVMIIEGATQAQLDILKDEVWKKTTFSNTPQAQTVAHR